MVSVHVMQEKNWKRTAVRKENFDAKSRQKNERIAGTERDEPYLVRSAITIAVDEIARAADATVWRRLAASFTLELLAPFRACTMQCFF